MRFLDGLYLVQDNFPIEFPHLLHLAHQVHALVLPHLLLCSACLYQQGHFIYPLLRRDGCLALQLLEVVVLADCVLSEAGRIEVAEVLPGDLAQVQVA
jgi:hypothetical protein